jgi:hypothetical protein
MRSIPACVAFLTVVLLAGCGQDDAAGTPEGAGDTSSPAVTDSPETPPDSTRAAPTSAAAAADVDGILVRALTHEHQTKATYDDVVARLGDVAPFSAVAPAEAQHIAELEAVARARGVDVSGITATASPAASTLAEACQVGVQWEEATVALYDELLPQVAAHPDVEYVFTNLRSASQDRHLPAFERCA